MFGNRIHVSYCSKSVRVGTNCRPFQLDVGNHRNQKIANALELAALALARVVTCSKGFGEAQVLVLGPLLGFRGGWRL